MRITESRLRKFIRESVSERASVKKLRVFDFDDTLVMTNSFIKIKKQNGEIMQITPAQYAVYDKEDDDIFDFSDFSKVNDPLIIKWTFKILERVIAARDRGEGDVIILTARSSESQRAIKDFFANSGIEDIEIVTLGTGEPAAKANYVISLIDKYGYNFIEFFDDSKRNIDTMANTIKSTYPRVQIRMHHIKSHINEMRKRKIVNERVKHGSSYPPTFDEFTELTAQQQGDVWIFFDTETTGLQYENEEVQATQLSCIAYYTNNFETMPEEVSGGRFDIKLALSEATEEFMETEPESKFSIKNLLLMTDYADDTVKKVKPGYVIHEFEEYLHRMKKMSSTKKIVFIAQNSPFDVGIINTLYHRMAVQPPDHEVWDTKAVIDLYFKPVLAFLKNSPDVTEEDKDLINKLTVNGRISGSLGNITSAFNIKNDKWHQAIEDVRMTMEMMFKIMQYLRAKSPEIRNTVASSPFNAMAGDPVYGVSSYKKRQMSENKLRALVNEIITESTIADSPITLEFKETTRGSGEEYSVFLRHPDFEKHIGYVQVIQYWDQ